MSDKGGVILQIALCGGLLFASALLVKTSFNGSLVCLALACLVGTILLDQRGR